MSITRDQLLTFLKKKTRAKKLDGLTDDAPLFSSGVIDSFVMIELVDWLGKQTGTPVNFDHVGVEKLDTIDRILDYAKSHGR